MRSLSKKKIIIGSVCSLMLLAAILIPLLIIQPWNKPKTTQDWLNDFKASIVVKKDGDWQGRAKNIEIYEQEILVASFFMEYKVSLSGEAPVAYFKSEEKYYTLGTTEFDIYDEYYFAGGVLNIKRISGNEEIKTNYGATINEFWNVVENGVGKSEYNFSENNFSDLIINHENEMHSMRAKILDDKKSMFFGNKIDLTGLKNITISTSIDNSMNFKELTIFYNTLRNLETGVEEVIEQENHININSISKCDIIKPEWISNE